MCLNTERSYGRVFTSGFLDRLANDNRKSRENSYFSNSRESENFSGILMHYI